MVSCVPRVAVVMATFNGASFIVEQLASIQSQVGVDITIFISDDCSDDFTMDATSAFLAEKDCCVKLAVLSKGVKYGSATSNFLSALMKIPVSGFEYICFSDQDDIWLPNKLLVAIAKMKQTSCVGYSSNVIAWHPNSGKTVLVKKDDKQTPYDFMFQGCGPGCTMIMESHSVTKLVSFLHQLSAQEIEKIWFHDWFIYAFFRAQGMPWTIDKYTGLLYRQHASNVIGANSGFLALVRRFRLLSRWKEETLFLADILGYKDRMPLFKCFGFHCYFILKPFSIRRRAIDGIALFVLSVLCII